MAISQLLELARGKGYEAFESRCLELLEAGTLSAHQLATVFEELERAGHGERLGALAQLVLENIDPARDPGGALDLARAALLAAPKNDKLRAVVSQAFRQRYGDNPHFEHVLQASGMNAGRPARIALKYLDWSLTLRPGDTLISRLDDRVVEVLEIDLPRGLFTLRRENRTAILPATEVVRDYERIAADDFRVLKQLRPDQLPGMLEGDPAAVVIGLIRAHGGHIDADLLKDELVPRHIPASGWSKWWTRARSALKKSPHVTIEGRSPVILTYRSDARELEDEMWERFETKKSPEQWLEVIESYLREKAELKEPPDAELLQRCADSMLEHAAKIQQRRPADALACTLMLRRLRDKGVPADARVDELAQELLRTARDPLGIVVALEQDDLQTRALEVMLAVRPADAADHVVKWLPTAPAGLLDRLVEAALAQGRTLAVQAFIDAGLSDPANHPELLYWLWKGPKQRDGLQLPSDDLLFRLILDTLATLGRRVAADNAVVRRFRLRMKAALGLRDYDKARRVLERCPAEAAITIRHQLDRLEGMGDNAPARMLDLLRDAHPALWVVQRQQLQPWEDTETIWCTAEGLRKRMAERDEIVNVQMPANARRIGEAASHGDLSENSEYKFALEERDLLRARLAKVNDELSRAREFVAHDVPGDHVGIGSRVRFRRSDSGEERVLTFLGPFETDPDRGIFSYQAPLAQKLMGHLPGDRVALQYDGAEVTLEILSLENALAEVGGRGG